MNWRQDHICLLLIHNNQPSPRPQVSYLSLQSLCQSQLQHGAFFNMRHAKNSLSMLQVVMGWVSLTLLGCISSSLHSMSWLEHTIRLWSFPPPKFLYISLCLSRWTHALWWHLTLLHHLSQGFCIGIYSFIAPYEFIGHMYGIPKWERWHGLPIFLPHPNGRPCRQPCVVSCFIFEFCD